MTQDIQEQAGIAQRGPVPSVPVYNHMLFGPDAVTAPLDLMMLAQLLFMLAEKARKGPEDPPMVVTPQSLLERLRSLGVVGGNGSKLVGRDAVYESLKRLRELNYIRRVEPRENGKRVGPVFYEFYEFPAWNPEPYVVAASEKPQVGATSGIAGSGIAGSRSPKRTKRESPQVGATSGIAGSGNAGSRSPGSAFPQVGATSGNAVSPPHPQEEVNTSSPYPLTGNAAAPREEGEEVSFAPDDLEAAVGLFQRLPLPWLLGRPDATKLAPVLLSVMADQGWPRITALVASDRELLVEQLTREAPAKLHSAAELLRRKRVPNLPLYEALVAARACAPAPGAKTPTPPPYVAEKRGPSDPAAMAAILESVRKAQI